MASVNSDQLKAERGGGNACGMMDAFFSVLFTRRPTFDYNYGRQTITTIIIAGSPTPLHCIKWHFGRVVRFGVFSVLTWENNNLKINL